MLVILSRTLANVYNNSNSAVLQPRDTINDSILGLNEYTNDEHDTPGIALHSAICKDTKTVNGTVRPVETHGSDMVVCTVQGTNPYHTLSSFLAKTS